MNGANQAPAPRTAGSIISRQHVRVVTTPSPACTKMHAVEPASADAIAEPKISIIKSGDTVQAIEITCTCGEFIRLECQY